MKILVTGCAGFIGSHLCEALVKRGDTVIGMDNFDQFYSTELKKENLRQVEFAAEKSLGKFIFYEKSILDDLNELFKEHQFDSVCHLAAKAGVRPSIDDPVGYQLTNVVGTTNLLQCSALYNVPDFVFASSSSIYGEGAYDGMEMQEWDQNFTNLPVSPYAATKRSCELIGYTFSHLYNITFTALRYFTVYGPRQRPEMAIHKFLRHALQGKKIVLYGDPDAVERDFTYVIDAVAATIAAIDKVKGYSYREYNIGGSNPVKLSYLIDIIETTTELEMDVEIIERQPGDVFKTVSNISRAEKELGYRPSIPIERGIELMFDWMAGIGLYDG